MDLLDPIRVEDHVRGAVGALVTLVEYGDFECPFCARAAPLVRSLEPRFPAELRTVFRHNPRRSDHPHALRAACAAEAAAAQGKFWEMHDLLFSHQDTLDDESLHDHARTLGLNLVQFTAALESEGVHRRVQLDELSGVRNRILGTPTFFVNGTRYQNRVEFDLLAAAIDLALRDREAPSQSPANNRRRPS